MLETYQALLDGGVDFIDTAEVYGFGKSERLIGDCIRKDGRPVKVASKFAPFIARMSPRQLIGALDASLARLGLTSLDLYYVHFPFPFTPLETFADGPRGGREERQGAGRSASATSAPTRCGASPTCSARSNIRLAANEVSYSLMNRKAETNGVLEACKELDVALVAYFPLASGRLAAPPADGGKPDRAAVLRRTLAEVAQAHQASVSQVALNWLLARDPHVIPIPGASKAAHAQENAAALGWRLTDDEFAAIEAASAPLPN